MTHQPSTPRPDDPTTGPSTTRTLAPVTVVTVFLAVCLAGAAISVAAGEDPDIGRAATVIALATGALSLTMMALAALTAHRRPASSPPPTPTPIVRAPLIVLAIGQVTAVGAGIVTALFTDVGAAALSVIGTALLMTLIVLAIARWLRRRLR